MNRHRFLFQRRKIIVALFILLPMLLFFVQGCAGTSGAITGPLQELGDSEERHDYTEWLISPSLEYDTLLYLAILAEDSYVLSFYPDLERPFNSQMTSAEERAVRRLHKRISGLFSSTLAQVLPPLYFMSGAEDMQAFRRMLEDPKSFRRIIERELEIFSEMNFEGRSIPALLFNSLCGDLHTALGFLERVYFKSYWYGQIRPEMEDLSRILEDEVFSINIIAAIEALMGGSLNSAKVAVNLCYFARPNGISLSRNSFVMEDRTDGLTLARVAVHELLHGFTDWTRGPCAELPEVLKKDPLVRTRFESRNKSFGYNSYRTLTEEAWVKAQDQVLAEYLGMAEDPRERFFFHDEGLHPAALAFYLMLQEESEQRVDFDGSGMALSRWILTGRINENTVSEVYRQTFEGDPFSRFASGIPVTRICAAGDSFLDSLHPSYNQAMKQGDYLLFTNLWYTAENPEASITALNMTAERAGSLILIDAAGKERELRYLFPGNWSVERDGKTYFYRNGFFFRDSSGEPLEPPFRIRGIVPAGEGGWFQTEYRDLRLPLP